MIREKIKKILVPIDGSKNSLRGLKKAIFLARQCGATITGIFVLHIPGVTIFHPIRLPFEKERNEAKRIMALAKNQAAKNGIVFKHVIAYGDIGDEIVEFGHRKKFDLTVIGSRGLGAAKEIFLGSVSNYVMHKSKAPVLIVK